MNIVFYLLFIASFISVDQENKFKLENGDLIFQESCSGGMSDAIKDVTSGIDGYNFTHVGIVWIDDVNDSIYVLEATHPYVTITPLDEYMYPKDKECAPSSVVGRLRDNYRSLIPRALEEAKKLLGKPYDDAFDLANDNYYCSELVYDIFLKANNNTPVFRLNTMTFKTKDTGEFSSNWIDHFKKLGIPIPEGELGINPAAMSIQSDIIDIIHYY